MTRFPRHAAVVLAAAALAVSVTACNPPTDKAKPDGKTEAAAKGDAGPQIAGLPTEKDKVSYMIGMQMAKSLEPVKDEVDVDVDRQGDQVVAGRRKDADGREAGAADRRSLRPEDAGQADRQDDGGREDRTSLTARSSSPKTPRSRA